MKKQLTDYARKNYYGVRRAAGHVKNLLSDRGPKLLVLTYHRVAEDVRDNPLKTIVSRKTFLSHLDHLSAKFRISAIDEAVRDFRGGAAKTSVVLTFDDGYLDNYSTVFPVLKQKGLPAAFFVSSGYIGSKRPMWDWEVVMRGSRDPAANEAEMEKLKCAGLDVLERSVEAIKSDYDPLRDRCMDWDELKKLSDAGMVIGSHGVSHRSLARIPREEAVNEIAASKRELTARLGAECRYFSFPFGSARDYDDELIGIVRDNGYQACLLNVHGYNRPSEGLFSLKRVIMDEDTPVNFLFG